MSFLFLLRRSLFALFVTPTNETYFTQTTIGYSGGERAKQPGYANSLHRESENVERKKAWGGGGCPIHCLFFEYGRREGGIVNQ